MSTNAFSPLIMLRALAISTLGRGRSVFIGDAENILLCSFVEPTTVTNKRFSQGFVRFSNGWILDTATETINGQRVFVFSRCMETEGYLRCLQLVRQIGEKLSGITDATLLKRLVDLVAPDASLLFSLYRRTADQWRGVLVTWLPLVGKDKLEAVKELIDQAAGPHGPAKMAA
jgi:hypothetical protein